MGTTKNILVTGANDGIGKQTALELAKLGHNVFIHARNKSKCESAIEFIEKKVEGADLGYFIADFSSLAEVRTMAEKMNSELSHLDVLINNAGVYMKKRELSSDGFEMTFAVNHLAPFLLTNLTLNLLKNSEEGRIINVSSIASQRANFDFDNLQGEKSFDGYGAYALSKLANILFTFELAERLESSNITVNCLHPGVIGTKLLHKGFGMGGGSLEEGSETSVYLAVSPEVKNITGKYFLSKKIVPTSAITNDTEIRRKFWDKSEELVKLK